MVTSCPMEDDPRKNVEQFVKDGSIRSIAGLRREGLLPLVDVVLDEIKKQHPETNLIVIDRDTVADNRIDFPKELEKYVRSVIKPGVRNDLFIFDDVSVKEWQSAFVFIQNENVPDVHIYFGSIACRQIPACYKLL